MSKKIRNQSGLTFIELIVAMLLVGLLSICIISANLFIQRYLKKYEDNNKIYDDGNFITSQIKHDLLHCQNFRKIDSLSYVIQLTETDSLVYTLKDSSIVRNDKRLTTSGIKANFISLSKLDFEIPTPDSILISGKTNYINSLAKIQFNLSYGNQSEEFESEIRLQNEAKIY